MDSLVSIITPTYNSEKFISATIQSVQKQTYSNWELIIIDDFSTDKTVEIINNEIKSDARIKLYSLTKNEGTGVARNHGVDKSKGSYISFLDSDDLWKPNKLERQLNFMKENNLLFTFSFYECIDDAGIDLNIRKEAPGLTTYKKLFFCNYIGNSTVIYNAEILGKIPINQIRKRQDWMLWLTIVKKIKAAQPVPEVLAYYRIRNNSISSSKMDLLKFNFNVYHKFHKMNYFASFGCIMLFIFTQLIIKPRYSKKI
ncbi:glycosyltransferase family 2 protein [Flavobacterium sp.]|uniref:glycosyltransferase family 2 protein n=1 Tax=Flavobacterium sp. TaxID=239 RepID=UPI0025EDDB29|nr:glycosyltransferase family 2 protein [Flavobacterium sp.]